MMVAAGARSRSRGSQASDGESPSIDATRDRSPGNDRFEIVICGKCFQDIERACDLMYSSHRPCHYWCAKRDRYCEDQAKKLGGVQAFRKYKEQSPHDYAYRLMDMGEMESSIKRGGRRGSSIRECVKQIIEDSFEFEKKSYVRPVLFLGKRAFVCWHERELGYTKQNALTKWEDDFIGKCRRKEEDGVVKLAVTGHSVEVIEKGKQTDFREGSGSPRGRHSRRRPSHRGSSLHTARRSLHGLSLSGPEDAGGEVGSGRRQQTRSGSKRRCGSRSPSRCLTPRRSSVSPMASPPSKNLRNSADTTCCAVDSRSHKPGMRRGRSSSHLVDDDVGAGAGDADRRGNADAPKESRRARSKDAKADAQAKTHPSETKPEELTDKKVKVEEGAMIDLNAMQKSHQELEQWKERVNEDHDDAAKLAQFDVDGALASSMKLKQDMAKLMATLRSSKLSDFDECRQKVDAKKHDIQKCQTELASYVRAAKKYVDERKFGDKKKKSQLTYQEGKQAKHFGNQGCGKKRAMLGSSMMYHGDPEKNDKLQDNWVTAGTCAFDSSEVKLWLAKSPIHELVANLKSHIEAAEDKLLASLAKKANASQRGMLRQLALEGLAEKTPTSWPDKLPKPHALSGEVAGFAIAVRKHTLRYGVTQWPLLGMGCFVVASRVPICLLVLDTKTLIDKGEMQLLDQLDDVLGSKNLRDISWPMVRMPMNSVCWVPYGKLPMACGFEEVNCFSVFPWAVGDLLAHGMTEEDGTEFLFDATKKMLAKHSDKDPWQQIAKPFAEFVEQSVPKPE